MNMFQSVSQPIMAEKMANIQCVDMVLGHIMSSVPMECGMAYTVSTLRCGTATVGHVKFYITFLTGF